MIKKFYIPLVIVMVVAFMVLGFGCRGPAGEEEVEPIVIGYVGMTGGPIQCCMDAAALAAKDINEEGGILGRPVKVVIGETKGQTTLAKEAVTRLVMDDKVTAYIIEGKTEIALACQETSAGLYPEYPHLAFANYAVDPCLTMNVYNDYDKYKFYFGDGMEGCCQASFMLEHCGLFKNIGCKKIAIMQEDRIWTEGFFEGFPTLNIPPLDTMVKDKYDIDVVYFGKFKADETMFLPIFELIKKSGAEGIFWATSWVTDTVSVAKQWPESSCKDLPLELYAGMDNGHGFWDATGGKCLGSFNFYNEAEVPLTSKTIPVIREFKENGVYLAQNSYSAYSLPFIIKGAMESVGSTTDIEAIIRALETTEVEVADGIYKMCGERIPPFFHYRISCDPHSPRELLLKYMSVPICQWSLNGEMVPLWPPEVAEWDKYKSPNELRKEAGWTGY